MKRKIIKASNMSDYVYDEEELNKMYRSISEKELEVSNYFNDVLKDFVRYLYDEDIIDYDLYDEYVDVARYISKGFSLLEKSILNVCIPYIRQLEE